ncbi:MAG: metallophosphoesterase [Longimicrobiaceae bacterium]
MPTLWRVLAFLLVWDGILWGVPGWLFAPLLPGGWLAVLAMGIVLLAPFGVLARGFSEGAYPSAFTRVWIFRPFWYGQFFLLLLAPAGVAGALAGLPFGAAREGGRVAVGIAAAALATLALWGYAGTRRLVVRPLELAFDGLPEGLDGMRIVQLSDLHVGPHTRRRHLARVMDAVRAAEPDLVVLTGDQVDDYPRDVEPLGSAFGGLAAPLGVIAIAGNHDVYAGWGEVRRGMEALGWRVLVNEAVPLERGGSHLWVAGTGDPARGALRGGMDATPDVGRTLAGVPPGAFAIVLAHNPALWPELAARGVPLTLSGHTHYGQLAIPRLGWSLASPFLEHAMGLHTRNGATLYINPGTNYWGIPMRVGTPPEVTVVTLRRRA